MVLMHNLSAMNTDRMYNINIKKKVSVAEKLSSGYKINRAADDAAGLSISEKMRRQIRGLTQGVENTQDGISLCQVADGALAEVSEMLHRITELSVKAANGTNSEVDREYIQSEIQEILNEIDRIGDSTTFNEQPVFKGTDNVILNADGTPATNSSVPFEKLELANVTLGKTPLMDGDGGDDLHLKAIVNDVNSVLHGRSFNLIFGDGSTSNSSIRITDVNGNKTVVKMDSLTASTFTSNNQTTWSRTFTYNSGTGVNLEITQTVEVFDGPGNNEKNYGISYKFDNKGSEISNLEFMFHADTAYNNNDQCEGYFINNGTQGERIEQYCVYNKDANGSALMGTNTSSFIYNDKMPQSFSIVDVDNALSFSEKISFDSGEEPDTLSIGHYNEIDDWSYYNSLNRNLGVSTERKDLGFSLYYDMDTLQTNTDQTIKFNYGIVSVASDPNIGGITPKPDDRPAVDHIDKKTFWIQSGTEVGSGLYISIDEMNTDVLGLRGLNVSTIDGANNAMDKMNDALKKINTNRSTIGAYQNRMEHIVANEENVIENTTAAESRIRDTDMAEAMVMLSNLNILTQAGEAMLAQANQSKQGVVSLLS